MKPITEYQDYRKYMLDYFDWRKSTSVFSWRKFSKQAGFASPSYLKLVCNGKGLLSHVGVPQVARAMNLCEYECEYFKYMVDFANLTDASKKKEAFCKMDALREPFRRGLILW